jgi:hypothetical protein
MYDPSIRRSTGWKIWHEVMGTQDGDWRVAMRLSDHEIH